MLPKHTNCRIAWLLATAQAGALLCLHQRLSAPKVYHFMRHQKSVQASSLLLIVKMALKTFRPKIVFIALDRGGNLTRVYAWRWVMDFFLFLLNFFNPSDPSRAPSKVWQFQQYLRTVWHFSEMMIVLTFLAGPLLLGEPPPPQNVLTHCSCCLSGSLSCWSRQSF